MDYSLAARGDGEHTGEYLTGGGLDIERVALPGYRFDGFIEPGPLGVRLIATSMTSGDKVVLHAVQPCTRTWGIRHRGRDARRFVEHIAPLRRFQSPHTLPIVDIHLNLGGAHWLATPFVGSSAGITTLEEGLQLRDDNRFGAQECILAAEQLLSAVRVARKASVGHGAIKLEDVIVDRKGSLIIELFGVRRALAGAEPAESAGGSEIWGEVRSVARLVYRLYTGVDVPRDWIDPERLVKRADRRGPDKLVASWIKLVLFREQPLGVDEAIAALRTSSGDAASNSNDSIAARAGRSVLRAALRPLEASSPSDA